MEKAVLFLCDRWSSYHGGIQTVNRELCIALANLLSSLSSAPRVKCLVQHATDPEIDIAKKNNVDLIVAEPSSIKLESKYKDQRVLTSMWNPELDRTNLIAIIGHSKFTGLAARNICDTYQKNAKVINFMHMDPEQLESMKNREESGGEIQLEKRAELEIDAVNIADKAVAIGPLMFDRLHSIGVAQRKRIKDWLYELNCGMHERELRREPPKEVRFLMFGRTDDIKIKGFDIFAEAAGIFTKKWNEKHERRAISTPKFIVMGARADEVKELQKGFKEIAQRKSNGIAVDPIVRTYKIRQEALEQEILQATSVVMPSRAEGYGLVALETISYGVPVIVSKISGVGLLLHNRLPKLYDRSISFLNVQDIKNVPVYLAEILFRLSSDKELALQAGYAQNWFLRDECLWSKAAHRFARDILQIDLNEESIPQILSKKIPISLNQFIFKEFAGIPVPFVSKSERILEKDKVFLKDFTKKIQIIYLKLSKDPNPDPSYLLGESSNFINFSKILIRSPLEILKIWSSKDFEIYFELSVLRILLGKINRTSLMDSLFMEIISLIHLDQEDAINDAIPAVESLVLILGELELDERHRILNFLSALSNDIEDKAQSEYQSKDVINMPLVDSILFEKKKEDIFGIRTILRQLLQTGLYPEVIEFLDIYRSLPNVEEYPLLRDFNCSIISFLSRKGGTGKSTLALLSVLHFIDSNPKSKACIIDLDITGPVWQYLLFPEENKPSRFLNELIDEDQLPGSGLFTFTISGTKKVEDLLETSTLLSLNKKVSVLTFRDLSRTNRLLLKAIQNNCERFFNFLVSIIEQLDKNKFDLVVIDNAPGFGVLPLLSHSITNSVKEGISVIVSTPFLPDIRGTIIDISDERLLYKGKSPIWIVNKATKEAEEYLNDPHNAVEIARQTKAYSSIIPQRPLIINFLKSRKHFNIPLPLDNDLLSFSSISAESLLNEIDILKASKLMKTYMERVVPEINKRFNLT